MKITLNPLLMVRTPSSLSLNALLIINGLLFEREKKTPTHALQLWADSSLAFHCRHSGCWHKEGETTRLPLMLTSPLEL